MSDYVDHARQVFACHDVFLVGWCVRDVLLWLTQYPTDIDITMWWIPDDIWKSSDRSSGDWFRTEKFGTMTYIRRDVTQWDWVIQYECTPLRTESWYKDRRHPDEIQWSSDIILDAGRRDFTINCLYYTVVDLIWQDVSQPSSQLFLYIAEQKQKDPQWKWYCFVDGKNVLIIQDHGLIALLFPMAQGEMSQIFWLLKISGVASSDTTVRHILLDPYQGIDDLERGVLRCVGSPDRRFGEDALRLMRALRIVNVLNCRLERAGIEHDIDIETETWRSIKKNYYLIQTIAKERIKDEILKAFTHHNPFGFVALLDESNMLKFVFPAVAATKGVNQPIRYHPLDTYHHTIMTLWNLQQLNVSPLVKLGMLYHDVGKTEQYHMYTIGLNKEEMHVIQWSWLNHSVCGAEMCERDLKALMFSTKMVEEVSWYVRHHMEPWQILTAAGQKKLKKIRQRYSEFWEDRVRNVFDICKADRMGQYNPLQSGSVWEVSELYILLDELIASEGQFVRKNLNINGHDLMELLDLTPGPLLKDLLDKAFERVSGDIERRNQKDIILVFLKWYLKQIQR